MSRRPQHSSPRSIPPPSIDPQIAGVIRSRWKAERVVHAMTTEKGGTIGSEPTANCESFEFSLPPSLAAGPHARCQPWVLRSPAVHAPGVRSARSCHMPAARPESLPHGQLSAPCGLRIRAFGSPLARSASGRVLSPHYAAIWPDERLSEARVRHASRPGSGAHPTRGRPVCCRHALVRARTVHRPARAAKHSSQHSSGRHYTPSASATRPLH